MQFTRRFTDPDKSPFETLQYETRASIIRNPDADLATETLSVEVPTGWSQTAVDILAQKYLRRSDVPVTGCETSVKQVVDRLAGCWRHWGERLGYFDSPADAKAFYDEAAYMLLTQMAAPNSPQWFNTGLAWKYGITGEAQGHWYVDPEDGGLKASTDAYSRPQPHACFIQSVDDDLLGEHGLYSLLAKEGRIFKYGSGTGTNFSSIRAEGEPLKGGGKSSGLMSFLKVFDRAAGAIKSGGTTRRAAKMVCLDLDHPEIEAFIRWKSREEAKVAAMVAGSRLLNRGEGPVSAAAGPGMVLIPDGWAGRMEALAGQGLKPEPVPELDTGFEGEAYATVSGQNSNNSVRVPAAFLEAVQEGRDWNLTARTDGSILKTVKAQQLWDLVALSAWESADPGVQFSDTINEWHTCPKDGPIRASNPCSEYMFLDDTACNLASLNLVRFQDADGSLRIEDFRHAVRIWTVILDISVGMAQFPSKDIAQKTHDFRTLGLGYANLGAFLMRAGIPYDGAKASAYTGGLTALMGGEAYAASAEMAEALGAFPRFAPNREDMLRVVRNHVRAARGETAGYEGLTASPIGLDRTLCPGALADAAEASWGTALSRGESSGYRNAQVTVLAPTGTIGLLMDCDTTGIEPDFSLVKFKKLSGGGYMKIVNRSLPMALRTLGYGAKDVSAIVTWCVGSGTLEAAPHIDAPALYLRGFPDVKTAAVEKALSRSLSLSDAFSPYVLGAGFLKSLGIPDAVISRGGQAILEDLGFTPSEIDEADLAICGAQTVEGAPGLDPAHYPVFDCANPCGRGVRCVSPQGHLRIMAAAQPFLSGAISKTVNLPATATVADVRDVYFAAWKSMIKAVAVYRDGSKLSQPLNSKVRKKAVQAPGQSVRKEAGCAAVSPSASFPLSSPLPVKSTLAPVSSKPSEPETAKRPVRMRLPTRRGGFVQEATVSGHKVFLRTGEYPDGSLGEIFIDMYKEGAAYRGILNCFAVLTSKALQYGVPLEELVDTFTFTRFEPAGPVEGHDHIKNCTSILDLIFRVLGSTYLGETDYLHIKPAEAKAPPAKAAAASPSLDKVMVTAMAPEFLQAAQDQKAMPRDQAKRAGYTGESCGSCCSIRVRRNGTCVVCEDCGTTSGCS
ncbi:MAG: ribonucleoside-diphosphate reductase, adenosylcobalamin-dependent [Fibrobacteres bacterium]|nr:ribonucleoside-diphosphate reductase, adenosylcobalamin-dependent [Fibrobacterota bacterium]